MRILRLPYGNEFSKHYDIFNSRNDLWLYPIAIYAQESPIRRDIFDFLIDWHEEKDPHRVEKNASSDAHKNRFAHFFDVRRLRQASNPNKQNMHKEQEYFIL